MTAKEVYESTPVGSLRWMVCKGGSDQEYESFALQIRELERMASDGLLVIGDRKRESMTVHRYEYRVQFKRLK